MSNRGKEAEVSCEMRKRAWTFAHKLLTLARTIPEGEGKRLLVVRTEEISKAMGHSQRAVLEEVQRFVFDVIQFMTGYGVYIACGCGYLSLMVCDAAKSDEIIGARDTESFTPESIDDYFSEVILRGIPAGRDTVREICDARVDLDEG